MNTAILKSATRDPAGRRLWRFSTGARTVTIERKAKPHTVPHWLVVARDGGRWCRILPGIYTDRSANYTARSAFDLAIASSAISPHQNA